MYFYDLRLSFDILGILVSQILFWIKNWESKIRDNGLGFRIQI